MASLLGILVAVIATLLTSVVGLYVWKRTESGINSKSKSSQKATTEDQVGPFLISDCRLMAVERPHSHSTFLLNFLSSHFPNTFPSFIQGRYATEHFTLRVIGNLAHSD